MSLWRRELSDGDAMLDPGGLHHTISFFKATPTLGLGATRFERAGHIIRSVLGGGFELGAFQRIAKANIHGADP
jgi:hypothetical protein